MGRKIFISYKYADNNVENITSNKSIWGACTVRNYVDKIEQNLKDKDVDIYLTGDGISNFKGVKNIIKDVTGLNVYDYKIPFNNSKDKYQTSI